MSDVHPCGPDDAAGDLLESWTQAGIAAGALPHPLPGEPLCPLPTSVEGTGLRFSYRTGFIAFLVLDSVSDGPCLSRETNVINNQGGQAGGGGPATRSHKSLSNHVADSLQKAPGPYWAAWPGAQESPPCGAPSSDGSADPGLTNLTPSALPCMPGLACSTSPAAVSRGSGLS